MEDREPQSHLYYDKYAEEFSNVALGILARAVGHNLKVTYYNSKKSIFKLIYSFRKTLLNNVSFYDYYSIHQKQLEKSDLIILDCFNFEKLSSLELKELAPSVNCEIVIVTNKKKEFDIMKKHFNLVSAYIYRNNRAGLPNVTNITGKGKGKSTFAFGYSLKKLINNKEIEIVYFDKGGDFYGEKYFFDKLKRIDSKFNYESFGLSRMNKNTFRFENLPQDKREAQKGLKKISRIPEHKIIIADELNTTINNKLLSETKIIETLSNIKNEILISGRGASKDLIKLAKTQIEVKEVKHYFKEGKGIKKGIDY